MFSLKAICDALAACYAPGTLTPPSGAVPIRAAFGQLPTDVVTAPVVLVVPQSGEAVFGSSEWTTTHRIDVQFYYWQRSASSPRVEVQRQLWLPVLLSATLGKVTLGLAGTVKSALPVGYDFSILTYDGEEYEGITIHYEIVVREPIAMVA